MNIYVSHPSNYDYVNELYRPLKEAALLSAHHFFLPHEQANVDRDAREEFKQTDVLIAEVSLASTGEGIELGQASAAGVPIICFYKFSSTPSSSLRFVTNKVIAYDSANDLVTKLQAELEQLQPKTS